VYVWVRKKGGAQSAPTDSSVGRVAIGRYSWEPIVYFASAQNDTVRAFNNHVLIWYPASWPYGQNSDTLDAVWLSAPPLGMIPASVAFTARQNLSGPALSMALKWDSIPAGYSAEDIRVYYRNASGQWVVYHEYTLQASQGLLVVSRRFTRNEVLMLGVDTQRPSVSIGWGDSIVVAAGTALVDSVRVTDNVAGVRVYVLYARGEDAIGVRATDTLDGTTGQTLTAVPQGYVTDVSGVRIYAVVSDGHFADTFNLSRQVVRGEASDVATEAQRWMPLRSNAVLDDAELLPVVAGVTGGGYNNTQMRVFRWFDTTSTDDVTRGGHGWVEYSGAKSALFTLEPSKLLWAKTLESKTLRFGRGVTVSLRDTQSVSLYHGEWTDIALPWRFSMYLGDILDATGQFGDSLHVYQWVRGADNIYRTELVYARQLLDTAYQNRSRQLNADSRTGYSIYNPLSTPITLKLPPTCAAISRYAGLPRQLAKTAASGEWSLKLVAWGEGGARLGSMVLGYSPTAGGSSVSMYPAGPGFGDVVVRVKDAQGGGRYGHAVAHRMEGGGVSYRVLFVNNGDAPATVTFGLQNTQSLADSLVVRVVDGQGNSAESGNAVQSVTIPAKGTVERVVTVGGPDYYRTAFAAVAPLSQLAAYPNPVRGPLSVQFMLPEAMGRVELVLVDALGRTVWKQRIDDVHAGLNRVVWDGKTGIKGAAANGMYLLQVSAFDAGGKQVARKERRVMVVR
jgi:hypothetical protein